MTCSTMSEIVCLNFGWEQKQILSRLQEMSFPIRHFSFLQSVAQNKSIESIEQELLNNFSQISTPFSPAAFISSQCDYGLLAWAILAKKYDLPGPSIAAAKTSVDKELQRLNCGQSKILKQPKYMIVDDRTCPLEAENSVNQYFFDKKIIVKPCNSRGSQGITVIQNNKFSEALQRAVKFSIDGRVMIEEYIEGSHYIVDTLGDHILVGKKFKSSQVEYLTSKIIFARPSNDLFSGIGDMITGHTRLVTDSEFDLNLPTTGEYIIAKDNSPFLIEYSNRGAGVWISTLVMSMINDIDPTQTLINFSFSSPILTKRQNEIFEFACIKYLGGAAEGETVGIYDQLSHFLHENIDFPCWVEVWRPQPIENGVLSNVGLVLFPANAIDEIEKKEEEIDSWIKIFRQKNSSK